jgi:hypothetical protein
MPAYVNMTHFTFVCTKCSGIHRELQYKIKGISVSAFTQEDVEALENGGNANFNAIFLARYNSARDIQLPTNGSDVTKLREFIRMKYTDMKWHADSGSNLGSNSGSSFSDSPPIQSVAASRRASMQEGTSRSSGTPKDVNRRASINIAPVSALKQSLQSGDLLDLMNSSPAAPPNSGVSTFQNAVSAPAPQSAGFNAFSSPDPVGSMPAFDPFNTASSALAVPFDPFSSGNNAFNQPAGVTPQQMLNVPFLQTNPAKEPEPVALQPTAHSNGNVRRSFSAFDEITPPPSAVSGNPFDAPSSNAALSFPPQQQMYPQMPPGPYGGPGYAQQTGFIQQQQQPGYPSMPPQGYAYGAPNPAPQVGYPYGPPQAGYPPQQFAPRGPPNSYGYPPNLGQQQGFSPGYSPGLQSGNPFGAAPVPQTSSGSYYPQQQQQQQQQPSSLVPPVAAPAASDPFASMGGTAWSSVGGKPKANQTQNFGSDVFCETDSPQQSMQQLPQQPHVQSANPFSSAPTSTSAPPEAVNPFDLF